MRGRGGSTPSIAADVSRLSVSRMLIRCSGCGCAALPGCACGNVPLGPAAISPAPKPPPASPPPPPPLDTLWLPPGLVTPWLVPAWRLVPGRRLGSCVAVSAVLGCRVWAPPCICASAEESEFCEGRCSDARRLRPCDGPAALPVFVPAASLLAAVPAAAAVAAPGLLPDWCKRRDSARVTRRAGADASAGAAAAVVAGCCCCCSTGCVAACAERVAARVGFAWRRGLARPAGAAAAAGAPVSAVSSGGACAAASASKVCSMIVAAIAIAIRPGGGKASKSIPSAPPSLI